MTEEVIEEEVAVAEVPVEEVPVEDAPQVETASNPNREAAKYRKQLRETEVERDQLLSTVEALQRSIIETHISTTFEVEPAGVFASGVELSAFLTEDGVIDPDKTRDVVNDAIRSLGLNTRRRPAADLLQGRPAPKLGETPNWSSLLSG